MTISQAGVNNVVQDFRIAADLRKYFENPLELKLWLVRKNKKQQFPFQRELALYLLLTASFWPNEPDRLLTAARIFAAALNFHFKRHAFKFKPRAVEDSIVDNKFRRYFSGPRIESFNERFFKGIGGQESILFCQSAGEFHSDLRDEICRATMIHDVFDYILKMSSLSAELSSSEFAFHAIASNIFKREEGYGIKAAEKRRAARKAGDVTKPYTVRERWRRANEMTILSYCLLRWQVGDYKCPGDPNFIVEFHDALKRGRGGNYWSLYEGVQTILNVAADPTSSLKRWTSATDPVRTFRVGGLFMMKEAELEHALALSTSFFQNKERFTEEQRKAVRDRWKRGWVDYKPSGGWS